MIFYFSGTGNSKWVAEEIARKIGDTVCNISKLSELPKINEEKQIGFVFPIYAWGVPEAIEIFAKKLEKVKTFTFGICTCGADAGIALKKLSEIYHLDSSYSIIMPSNYIIGEDLEDEDIILKKIKNAKKEIEKISNEIIQRKKVYRVNEGKTPTFKTNVINKGFNRFARTTKPFYVKEEYCNSCGLCAKSCPASTITLINGKPVWNEKCYQCLSCINNCPKFAIQYGKKTEKRRRYNIEKYLQKDN